MRYLGGKAKIAKRLTMYLESVRRPGQTYVEPFLGGCNVLPLMSGIRHGNEINRALVFLYAAVRDGWIPPDDITEEQYHAAKVLPDTDPLKAFCGCACSFGGKWFGGYARDNTGRNYSMNGRRGLLKIAPLLQGVSFSSKDYELLELDGNLVYCDPPYEGTTKYPGDFDHRRFWNWVRSISAYNDVYVSEYSAPDDFLCVLELERDHGLSGGRNADKANRRVEKLFTYFPF